MVRLNLRTEYYMFFDLQSQTLEKVREYMLVEFFCCFFHKTPLKRNLCSFTGLFVRSHIELPFYTKYLLIAAYLASYNPAHTDKRFFAKQGKRGLSNRAKAAAKGKKSNTQLTGKRGKCYSGYLKL